MTPAATPGRRALVGVATAVVCVLGVLAGLAVADLTTDRGPAGTTPELAGPTTSATAGTPSSSASTAPSVPEPGTSSTMPSSTTSATPPGSVAPTTTSTSTTVTPSSSSTASTATTSLPATTATTARPTTTLPRPTTTRPPIPALISVSYLQDASGSLVIKPRGGATITLVNSGGQAGQWLLTPPGAAGLAMSATSGTIAPNSSVTVTVTDTSGTPRSTVITGVVAPNTKVNIKVVVK